MIILVVRAQACSQPRLTTSDAVQHENVDPRDFLKASRSIGIALLLEGMKLFNDQEYKRLWSSGRATGAVMRVSHWARLLDFGMVKWL